MKLVFIDWVDSSRLEGWQNLDGLGRLGEDLSCRSVGWLFQENEESIIIVPHVALNGEGGSPGQAYGCLSVPKKAILRKRLSRGMK